MAKKRGGQRKPRTNASKLPGCSLEDMQAAGFLLSAACRNKSGMQSFGYIEAKGHDRFQFHHPQLPRFFGAHLNPVLLSQNTKVILQNLQVKRGARDWILGFDETTFNSGYSGTFFFIFVIHFEFVCQLQRSK